MVLASNSWTPNMLISVGLRIADPTPSSLCSQWRACAAVWRRADWNSPCGRTTPEFSNREGFKTGGFWEIPGFQWWQVCVLLVKFCEHDLWLKKNLNLWKLWCFPYQLDVSLEISIGPLGVLIEKKGTESGDKYPHVPHGLYRIWTPNKSIGGWYVGVSKNRATPKSSMLIGFSTTNHPFWGTPIFGNTHVLSPLASSNDYKETTSIPAEIVPFTFNYSC